MVLTFMTRYMAWHYAEAPRLMVEVWRNLFWFIGHLFSIAQLTRSLFSPWKRIVAERHKKWDFEDIASAILANTVSRIIGALLRTTLIVIGLVAQFCWLCFGIVFYASWFFIPIICLGLVVYGSWLMYLGL